MICRPSRNDLEQFFEHSQRQDSGEAFFGPTEPLQVDENESARKLMKKQHEKEKASAKKKSKALKEKLLAAKALKIAQETNPGGVDLSEEESPDSKIEKLATGLDRLKAERRQKNAEFTSMVSRLWIDDFSDADAKNLMPTVRNSSSREILGFVTFGGTCFRKSKQIGFGFSPVPAVKQVFKNLLTNLTFLLLPFFPHLLELMPTCALGRSPCLLTYLFAPM